MLLAIKRPSCRPQPISENLTSVTKNCWVRCVAGLWRVCDIIHYGLSILTVSRDEIVSFMGSGTFDEITELVLLRRTSSLDIIDSWFHESDD